MNAFERFAFIVIIIFSLLVVGTVDLELSNQIKSSLSFPLMLTLGTL